MNYLALLLLAAASAAACTGSGSAVEGSTTPNGMGGEEGAPAETGAAGSNEVGAPSSTSTTNTTTPGSAPSNPLTPSDGALLGRDAVEMFLDHGGRQVYALHSFGEWLYFNGSIGGPHTFRIRKDEPRLIRDSGPWPWLEELGPWSGSAMPNVFHSDATHVYWLDQTAIFRQGLDGVVESVPLDADPLVYYVLDGDADTVFAATESCIRIVLMDKATLSLRVFEPENLIPLGGPAEVASDGTHVYCTASRSLLEPGLVPQSSADVSQVIHTLDKASGDINSVDLNGGDGHPKISGMLYHGGKLYAGETEGAWFGIIASQSGVFTPLFRSGYIGEIHPDRGSGQLYWADGGTVVQFDPVTSQGVPLIPVLLGSMQTGSAADETHVYFVQYDITVRATNEKLVAGIVRVRKPE